MSWGRQMRRNQKRSGVEGVVEALGVESKKTGDGFECVSSQSARDQSGKNIAFQRRSIKKPKWW